MPSHPDGVRRNYDEKVPEGVAPTFRFWRMDLGWSPAFEAVKQQLETAKKNLLSDTMRD